MSRQSIGFHLIGLLLIVFISAVYLLTSDRNSPIVTAQTNLLIRQESGVISGGGSHTCAVTDAGGLKCWGNNGFGQLGNGNLNNSTTITDVIGLGNGVTAVSAGGNHTCAITDGGSAKCWGRNNYGQLGYGSTTDHNAPVGVIGLEINTTAIQAGGSHTCALTTNGGVKCWGRNNYGQLGDETRINRLLPTDVTSLTSGVTAISTSGDHTCAITDGGGVKCWGNNGSGQLGNDTTDYSTIPVDVVGLNSGIVAISAGLEHTCALTDAGGIKCWGNGRFGKLGTGTTANSLVPVDAVGSVSGMTSVHAGRSHTCASTSLGRTKCWGGGSSGQLGQGLSNDSYTPVDVIGFQTDTVIVAVGENHSCAMLPSATLKCWGYNGYGQLGNNTISNSNEPLTVLDLTVRGPNTGYPVPTPTPIIPTPIPAPPIRQESGVISGGGSHTCAVTDAGGLKCWGNNGFGQLGNGNLNNSTTIIDVIGLGNGVTAVSAGGNHTCAITDGGSAKCWGRNNYGQLGYGSTTDHNAPVGVIGLEINTTAIQAGGSHTCALTTNGGVKCWGRNNYGQLGDETRINRLLPTDVTSLTSGVTAISTSGDHTCAITDGGGVKCWGNNGSGQLGNDTTDYSTIPVDVVGLNSGIVAISAGLEHTCALTDAGGIKCWGNGRFGKLGTGTTANSLVPVDAVGSVSGMTSVHAGRSHTCASTSLGRTKCWGGGSSGQLGQGLSNDSYTPVDVIGFQTDTVIVAVGENHSCAMLPSATLKCWGYNGYGQLGNNTISNSNEPLTVLDLTVRGPNTGYPVPTPTPIIPTPLPSFTPLPPTPTFTPVVPVPTPTSILPTPTPDPLALPPEPPTGANGEGRPWIANVKPCISGPYYFRPYTGLPVLNKHQISVDWQGLEPQTVIFSVNNFPTQVPAWPGSTPYHLSLSDSRIQYGAFGDDNLITVQAIAQNGQTSDVYHSPFIGIGIPWWLPPTNKEKYEIPNSNYCLQKPIKMSWQSVFPQKKLDFEINPPAILPVIGGNPIALKGAQAALDVAFAGDGQGSLKLSGSSEFHLAGDKISAKLFGIGDGQIQPNNGMQVKKGTFGLELAGEVTEDWPLVEVVCSSTIAGCNLLLAEGLPVIGGLVRWFNEVSIVRFKAKPTVGIEVDFFSEKDGWRIQNGEGKGSIPMTLSLITEVIQNLSAEAYGGGTPEMTLHLPATPSLLKELAYESLVGIKLKAFTFERTFEASQKWTYSPNQLAVQAAQADAVKQTYSDSDWVMSSRDYLDEPQLYAQFSANENPLRLQNTLMAADINGILEATQENLITGNIYPESHPAIAAASGTAPDALLLWIHDDLTKPVAQGQEIHFSLYKDGSWQETAPVTNDTLQDFNPQVAFDDSGQAVAVWNRNKNIQSDTTAFDAAYTNAFEIAYATWDGSSWSPPMLLTDNEVFDHTPRLVRGNDGNLLLVWFQNSTGEMLGTADKPDRILYSVWNGTQWVTPQPILSNVSDTTGLTIARHDNNNMAVSYSRGLDDDFRTALDHEIFVQTWDGINWGLPQQITADGQADNQPTLFYTSSGQLQLLWLKDNILHTLLDGLQGAVETVDLGDDTLILDYASTQSTVGNMALLWQSYSDEGVDIFYTAFDQANRSFSKSLQLTHDQPLEKFMTPVVLDSGELLMTYSKVELRNEAVTLEDGSTVEGVTVFGANDLYVLQHTFGADLVLTSDAITVTPINPTADSPIQIDIVTHNAGDMAVVNPQIALYNGDPTTGGTLIAMQDAPLTLVGGAEIETTFDWTMPSVEEPISLFAIVDPNNQINELSKNNNQSMILLGSADLAIADLRINYGANQQITTTATISNMGVIDAQSTEVLFRLDDPITGTIVASTNTPLITAGSTATVKTTWTTDVVPSGSYRLYAVADADNQISESIESNNDDWAGVHLLPDLSLRSTAILTGFADDGTRNVSIWIFNTGTQDAASVEVGAYKNMPYLNGPALAVTQVDIPADSHRVVTINIGNYTGGFYAAAGVHGEITDRNPNDNILLIGQRPSEIADLNTDVNHDTVRVGESVIFSYTYANTGPDLIDSVSISATVPSHTRFVSDLSTAGWSCPDGSPAGAVCILNMNAIAQGQHIVHFGVIVDSGQIPYNDSFWLYNRNEVTVADVGILEFPLIGIQVEPATPFMPSSPTLTEPQDNVSVEEATKLIYHWQSVTDAVSYGFVQTFNPDGDLPNVNAIDVIEPTYTDEAELIPGSYRWEVKTISTEGLESAVSRRHFTVAPHNPMNVLAIATSCQSIMLTWDDRSSHEQSYHIYRDGQKITESPKIDGGSGEFADTNRAPNTIYEYKVVAYHQAATLAGVVSSAITPACPPDELTLTTNVIGDGTVTVDQTGPYVTGMQVQLTAMPENDWRFVRWESSMSLGGSSSLQTILITMTDNMTLTAVFEQTIDPTATPEPSLTLEPSATPEPTDTVTTPEPSKTPEPSATPESSVTPEPSATPDIPTASGTLGVTGGLLAGASGSEFTITGANFPPSQQITIRIDTVEVGTVQTDESGKLEFVITSKNAAPARYTISIDGANQPIELTIDNAQSIIQPINSNGPRIAIPSAVEPDSKTYLPWIGN